MKTWHTHTLDHRLALNIFCISHLHLYKKKIIKSNAPSLQIRQAVSYLTSHTFKIHTNSLKKTLLKPTKFFFSLIKCLIYAVKKVSCDFVKSVDIPVCRDVNQLTGSSTGLIRKLKFLPTGIGISTTRRDKNWPSWM